MIDWLSLVCPYAILGHSFSLFLKFRGGKGVATTIGGLLVLMCPVLLLGLVVWLIIFYTKKSWPWPQFFSPSACRFQPILSTTQKIRDFI